MKKVEDAYVHYSFIHNYSSEKCHCNSHLTNIILHTSYIRNFKPLAIFCQCTAGFVSNYAGNPFNRFSRGEANILSRRDLNQS